MRSKFTRLRSAALAMFVCTGAMAAHAEQTVMLSWQRPTTNSDNSPLTDLFGYYILMGSSPQTLLPVMFAFADETSVSLELGAGPHFFAMASYSLAGTQSELTPVVSYTVPGQ